MSNEGRMVGGNDLYNEVIESLEQDLELYKKIYIDDDHIVLNIQYEYSIPLREVGSFEGILSWVLHLSEKTWIEKDHLSTFIKVAHKASGLPEFRS